MALNFIAQVSYGFGTGFLLSDAKRAENELGGEAGQNFLYASVAQIAQIALMSCLFAFISEEAASVPLKKASHAFVLGSRGLFIPLCLFASIVRNGHYGQVAKNYNFVVDTLLTPLSSQFEKLKLNPRPAFSERTMRVIHFISDHSGDMALVATAIGALVYTLLGNYVYGGALALTLGYHVIRESGDVSIEMKDYLTKFLNPIGNLCAVLSPQSDVFTRIVCFCDLVSPFTNQLTYAIDKLLPFGTSLAQIDGPVETHLHLSRNVMTQILMAPPEAFQHNPAFSSKPVLVKRNLRETKNFNLFLEEFRKIDLIPHYKRIKKGTAGRSDQFGQLLIDKFRLNKEDIADLNPADQIRERQPQISKEDLDFELRLMSLKEKYLRTLKKEYVLQGFSDLASDCMRLFLKIHDQKPPNPKTDFVKRIVDVIGAKHGITYDEGTAAKIFDILSSEIKEIRNVGEAYVERSLDECMETLATEKGLTKEQYAAKWTTGQMDIFIDRISQEGKDIKGELSDTRQAISRFAQYCTHFTDILLPMGIDTQAERQDAVLNMALKGGQYCAEQLLDLSKDLLDGIACEHLEDRIATHLQTARQQLIDTIPNSHSISDIHAVNLTTQFYRFGFCPLSNSERNRFNDPMRLFGAKIVSLMTGQLNADYIEGIESAFKAEKYEFYQHMYGLIQDDAIKAVLADPKSYGLELKNFYRLMLVMHGMIIPKDPKLLQEPGPGTAVQFRLVEDDSKFDLKDYQRKEALRVAAMRRAAQTKRGRASAMAT